MAKKSPTSRPARTPREVLQPRIAEIGAMTLGQLAARAAELDQARTALKAAGDAAAAAQAAFDAVASDATDEQRDNALNALENAEKAVKAAEAALKTLTDEIPAGSHGGDAVAAGPEGNHRTEGAGPKPHAVESASGTHAPPASKDQGGAGNAAGPAAGDGSSVAGVLVVTTKRPSRWRAGLRFTRGSETRIPMIDLTEAQFRAIKEDPVLETRVEPGEIGSAE